MKSTSLYTLGYEGFDVTSFVDRLHEAKVQTVIDVRELPLSRKKGFSKAALTEYLAAAGIAYVHAPTLGCPKEVRVAYRTNGDWAQYTIGFMKHLSEQDSAVRELAKLARRTTACLVCFEADFAACHRTYVGRAATRAGAPPLRHLTAKTVLVDQQLPVAA